MRVAAFAGAIGACLASLALGAQVPAPSIVTSGRIDAGRDINFASGAWPERVYVGQQVTYQIGIFLTDEIRGRLRSNPQFVPPDVRSVIAYDLPSPPALGRRMEGTRRWDVHVFSRALFPVAPGVVDIASARLTYQVPLSASIFSREESHSARSTPHRVTVRPPPVAGRPEGYSGAVGRLSVRSRADATPARVGDPLVLTVTVSGVGNVGLFPRPALQLPWGHVVPGPERVRVDSSASLVSGDKHFEWVVTPRESGVQVVPPIRYPFFNPYTEQYEVAVTAPLNVTVRGGTLATLEDEAREGVPRLGVRRELRADVPWPVATSPWFWIGALAVPVPILVRRLRGRPRRPDLPSPDRRLRALAAAVVPDLREMRRALRAALHARVPQTRIPHGMEGPTLERVLRRAGVSQATARAMRRVVAELDELAYAQTRDSSDGDLAQRVLAAMAGVDAEATPAGSTVRGARGAGALLLVLATIGVAGAAGDDGATRFREGLAAYDAGRMAEAHAAFDEVARARPRAADAWANAGTSAWEAGDTARAVVGWQRALRLEPLAGDLRARLRLTPGFRDGLAGDVPPLPVDLLAALGVLCWVAGWAGRWSGAPRWSSAALIGAALAGLVALGTAERIRGPRQLVVALAEQLRDAPAMGARPVASVEVGEGAREESRQGNWVRVRFPDGRTGWGDARAFASLEVPRGR